MSKKRMTNVLDLIVLLAQADPSGQLPILLNRADGTQTNSEIKVEYNDGYIVIGGKYD